MPNSVQTQELDPAHRGAVAKAKARKLQMLPSTTQLTGSHRHLTSIRPCSRETPTTKRTSVTILRIMTLGQVHPNGQEQGILRVDPGGEGLQSASIDYLLGRQSELTTSRSSGF